MSHIVRDKKKLMSRVHRIQGQLDALGRHIESEADCYETLQLATACRGALNALIFQIIEGHVRHHVVDPEDDPSAERVIAAQQLINVIQSYLK